MPQIEVQVSTMQRLKKLAEPFVDTPEMVILRALDALESTADNIPIAPEQTGVDINVDPRNIPNLTHTKILSAKVGAKLLSKPNWNSTLDAVLKEAVKAGLKANDIQHIGSVNVTEGTKNDEGYSKLDGTNISVQGQDSNAACRGIVMIARHLKIHVELEFRWRDKSGAAHAGKTARLVCH